MQRQRKAMFVVVCLLAECSAMPVSGAPPSTAEQRLAFAKQSAATYKFQFGDRPKTVAKLHPEPVLRWNNQVIREDDGFLFIWAEHAKGRPIAAAQFFLAGGDWNHEFQSICVHGFDATTNTDDGRNWEWRPTGPGMEFQRATDVGPPLESAGLRLRQMKAIAERFTASVDSSEKRNNPEQLRLLTTPIYRYSAENPSILDGAIMAFVQGTNPEIIILIEAYGTGPDYAWRYGFARMSSFYLQVHRDDKQVWVKERAPVPTTDNKSDYYFRLQAQVDRSSELSEIHDK